VVTVELVVLVVSSASSSAHPVVMIAHSARLIAVLLIPNICLILCCLEAPVNPCLPCGVNGEASVNPCPPAVMNFYAPIKSLKAASTLVLVSVYFTTSSFDTLSPSRYLFKSS